jgi:hypothetical protein
MYQMLYAFALRVLLLMDRYASRARSIRNSLRLNNKLSPEEELEYLRTLVQQLQSENDQLKARLAKTGL